MNTNLFIPPQLSCPKHGQHQKGWLTFSISPDASGVYQMTQICGLCVIDTLQQIGFTITEPETLKENEWILNEVPEAKSGN